MLVGSTITLSSSGRIEEPGGEQCAGSLREVAGPAPFVLVSFPCALDAEAVPDRDEQGPSSPLGTRVKEPLKELRVWPKVTPGVSGRAKKEPGTPDLPSLAGGRGRRVVGQRRVRGAAPTPCQAASLALPREPSRMCANLTHTSAPALGASHIHTREHAQGGVCAAVCQGSLPSLGYPTAWLGPLSTLPSPGPFGLGRPKPHPGLGTSPTLCS